MLSKKYYSEIEIVEESKILLGVYDAEYRHSYSMIFAAILEIKKSSDPDVDFIALTQNIETFKENVIQDIDFHSIKSFLEKLYDHVTLETARLSYLETFDEMQLNFQAQMNLAKEDLTLLQHKLNDTAAEVNSAKDELAAARSKIDNAIKETEGLKLDVITIIGIFAAIMLAFASGMSFTSSTLASMQASSIYKVSFIVIICGFVVFNTIFSLLYFIGRITRKDIYAKCNLGECVDSVCAEDCSVRRKIKRRLPYVYWVNFFFVILLILIFFGWLIEIKTIAEAIRSWLWCLVNR